MSVRGERDDELELFGQLYAQPTRERTERVLERHNQESLLTPPPAPPPGAPVQQEARLSHLPDGRLNTYNGQTPNARYDDKGQRVLPGGGGGARFIPPDEYKEFLQLGHGGIFDLDLDNIDVAPWRERGADLSAFFNYGLDERSWRKYVKSIRKSRLEQHLQNKIEAYGIDSSALDADLPPEVRRAIGGWEFAATQVPSQPLSMCEQSRPQFISSDEARVHAADDRYVDRNSAPIPDLSFARDGGVKSTRRGAADVGAQSNHSEVSSRGNATDSGDDVGMLHALQKQIEELQKEYKSTMESGVMTPQLNFRLQQRMLELKKRIVQHSAQS
ncbi:Pre-mRNA polyadenylation factor Fip1 [Ostreococcus tauri]|uniref:Fip1 CPSF Fip1 subunit n=1 Tax=Ostreococcus tauri TaxID=70448 RepID=Q01EC1_OSTTA|nr:Pre-mRNA polyadenylation factor Fip1 [Ostreococcus tauri]OUS41933.1 Fip1 CPSF Fip1 subunit [Ostreococcus tauri]CAL52332.2 Pre-mRNA polyadenylation factor Fip1 [Ostreococcus tauri]|eukprot:XP_003075060.1 Pre-mRNA polyadenylation factor Fip1 [Ostreococcus tauri]